MLPPDYGSSKRRREFKKRKPAHDPRKDRLRLLRGIEVLEVRMMPATFVVTTTSDSGPGSLRQEITSSNAAPGANTIDFDIPGSGLQTILPLSALPTITNPVLIDGTTQSGYASSPLIVIDGVNTTTSTGLDLGTGSTGSTIRGLTIDAFGSGTGIVIQSNADLVQSSYIGLTPAGTAKSTNNNGILIETGVSGTTIGGTTAGAGNVISGNTNAGLEISGMGSSGNLVVGNDIGTDYTGTVAVANGNDGVAILSGASGNTIGGTTASARNIISGNTNNGVLINGSGANTNLVEGNDIGTNAAGSAALGTQNLGVAVEGGGQSNIISGNLISGGNSVGLEFTNSGTSNNLATGNLIGTDATGLLGLPNTSDGVVIDDGASSNSVGGTTAAARNVISKNPLYGVLILDSGTTSNVVEGNYIGTDMTGTAALGNAYGVQISGGAANNIIGGTASGAGNVISGNSTEGIYFSGSGVNNNLVEGNDIGTNAAATAALANAGDGVRIDGSASKNTVGGTTAAARNIISGNTNYGVIVFGSGTNTNLVEGNDIGTNSAGSAALGGQGTGVSVQEGGQSNTIAANVLSGNNVGLEFTNTGTSNNVASGNDIGTDATGLLALANTEYGVLIHNGASSNTVGGTTAAARNIISESTVFGVLIRDSGTTSNVVEGNYIGTDMTGAAALGNVEEGIEITNSAANNTLGGTVSGAGNVISGNGANGVLLGGTGNVVAGNFIGLNAAGTAALANNGDGVALSGATSTTIGGTTAGARNVIGGNTTDGIQITGSGTNDNVVEGDYIGTNASGTSAVSNGDDGVEIDTSATSNTIGGTVFAARNVISGNTNYGVQITGSGATGNVVEGDSIGTDITGQSAISNDEGVQIDSGAYGNTIGGTATGAGDLISGNNVGVVIGLVGYQTGSASNNTIDGDLIGTDDTGAAALANDNAIIIVSGSSGNTIGGTTSGSGDVISGNEIGIEIDESNGNAIEGDDIGTDLTGSIALANGGYGISLSYGASSNTIGGSVAGAGNVISGNSGDGVDVAGGSDNLIAGNLIGTNLAGTAAIPNTGNGVVLDIGTTGNTIGGSVAAARNVISGNTTSGVYLTNGAADNLIEGNYIGTDVTGTVGLANSTGVLSDGSGGNNTIGGATSFPGTGAGNLIAGNQYGFALESEPNSNPDVIQGNLIGVGVVIGSLTSPANTSDGIYIEFSSGILVGGLNPGDANVISGNNSDGLGIYDSSNILVQGNFIGTNAVGTSAVPNNYGILINASSTDNTIGGITAAARNIISGNSTDGVLLYDTGTTGNVIEGDYIGTDATGSSALGNGIGIGAFGTSGGNTIGGVLTGEGNLISGNSSHGIQLEFESSGDVIEGNTIGLKESGTSALSNGGDGIFLEYEAGDVIGGPTAAQANVISANLKSGIEIDGGSGTVVEGNLIGTNTGGTTAVGNVNGVLIDAGSTDNTIGGTTAGAGNVISGNTSDGVQIAGSGTSSNVLLDNFIGTDITGTQAVANGLEGVNISGGASSNTIGGSDPVSQVGLVPRAGLGTPNAFVQAPNGDIYFDDNTLNEIFEYVPGSSIPTVVSSGQFLSSPNGLALDGLGNLIVTNGNFGSASGSIIKINLTLAPTSNQTLVATGGPYLTGYLPTGVVVNAAGNYVVANYSNTNVGQGLVIEVNATTGAVTPLTSTIPDYLEGITQSPAGTLYLSVSEPGTHFIGQILAVNPTTGAVSTVSTSAAYSFGTGISFLPDGNLAWAIQAGSAAIPVGEIIEVNPNTGSEVVVASGGDLVDTIDVIPEANGDFLALNALFDPSTYALVQVNLRPDANVISGNIEQGVEIAGSGTNNNLVVGNLIGTDLTGTVVLANGRGGVAQISDGIEVDTGASGNTIGGTSFAAGNVISGNSTTNTSVGLLIIGSGTTGNLVEGNYVGTDVSGTVALGNFVGVVIEDTPSGNTIGGTVVGAGNVISGNNNTDILLYGAANTSVLVQGNLLGLDATGEVAFRVEASALVIESGANTIGGVTAAARNVISGGNNTGITLNGSSATGNIIEGDYIGTDATGTINLASYYQQIYETGSAGGNTFGGTVAGAGNLIVGKIIPGTGTYDIFAQSNDLIAGNLIGTNAAGTALLGATAYGVQLNGNDNTIGGTTAFARNVLVSDQVYAYGNNNLIEGNDFGFDITGEVVLDPTGDAGVGVNGMGNTIGGTVAGAGNLIGGDINGGIGINGANSTGNLVEGNTVGLDKTGLVEAYVGEGVGITGGAHGNTIGGTSAAARNVISGSNLGISIDASSPDNLIEGNYIGTNVTGNVAIDNTNGIQIVSAGNTIGGTVAGSGNIIATEGYGGGDPSTGHGIWLIDSTATGNLIEGNLIGVGASGAVVPGSTESGIWLDDAPGNTIGGTTAAARNVISGDIGGILIQGTGSTGNLVEGNYIGTNEAGTIAFGNGSVGFGIGIEGSPGNTIGGTASGAGNLISGNYFGIFIDSSTATGEVIEGNDIGTNYLGNAALANNVGIEIGTTGGGNTIGGATTAPGIGAGNLIAGNSTDGIYLVSESADVIEGNLVGGIYLSAALGASPANLNDVYVADSSGIQIGGPSSQDENVISGASSNGVTIDNSTGTLVEGNLIGTNIAGTLGDGSNYGIVVENGSNGNTIGGTSTVDRNVISANLEDGIIIEGTRNVVEGNYIGTDLTGTSALANTQGIYLSATSGGNTIGGATTTAGTGAGNLIAASYFGIWVNGGSGVDVIEGNLIGAGLLGTVGYSPGNYNGIFVEYATGLLIGGPSSLDANVISGNTNAGIDLSDASGVVVEGNLIGTNLTGTAAVANVHGILIENGSNHNTVGGSSSLAANVISGNTTDGVNVTGLSTVSNLIEGNLIGTDVTGVNAVPNLDGIVLDGTGGGNTIGGATSTPGTGAGNLISGDTQGLAATNEPAADFILGNVIGLSSVGTPLTNLDGGIVLTGDTGIEIGGLSPLDANVISGNTLSSIDPSSGITIDSSTATLIEGNRIGTNVAGTASEPNNIGIQIGIGSTNNTIGGTVAGAGNVIDDNTGDGVQVLGGTGNAIRGNSIFNNGGLGIELGNTGVPLSNHLGGSNSGPNDDENTPVLTLVDYLSGSGTTIVGDLNTTPNTVVFIDFYTDSAENSTTYGDGQTYLGSVTVTTSSSGSASFTHSFNTLIRNAIISTTATTASGNTSEFSKDLAEDTPPIVSVVAEATYQTPSTAATAFNESVPVYFDASQSYSPDGDALTYTWDFDDGSALVTTSTPYIAHSYNVDATYVPTVIVNDGHGGIESNIDILTINKVKPTISFVSLPTSIAVGSTATFQFAINDPTDDLETAVINWGDGSTLDLNNLPAGSSTFTLTHDYSSPLAGGSTTATVTATVQDASNPALTPPTPPLVPLTPSPTFDVGGLKGTTTATLGVYQQNPAFANLMLSTNAVVVNNTLTLSGQIVDPNLLISHTVKITWGDSSTASTTIVLPPGDLSFSTTHPYLTTPGNASSGSYPISLSVMNSNGLSGATSTSVAVVDVTPVVLIRADPTSTNTASASLVASVTSTGATGQSTYKWIATTNGSTYATGTEKDFTFSAPTGGVFNVSLTVTDPDGVSGQATTQVLIGASISSGSIVFTPAAAGQDTVTTTTSSNVKTSTTFTPGSSIIYYDQGTGNVINAAALSTPIELVGYTGGTSTLIGGSGNDTLVSVMGKDYLEGTTGPTDFKLFFSGQDPTLVGSTGLNTIDLTATTQNITLNLGSQTLQKVDAQGDIVVLQGTFENVLGGSGNDALYAANGVNSSIVGGSGNDLLYGLGTGNDSIVGGSGSNTITGGAGNDIIYGLGTGNDSIVGGTGNATITGGAGNDIIYGLTTGNDSIVGGSGNATIVGGGSNDVIYGLTTGNDSIVGGSGNNTIVAGSGNDIIYGLTTGNDSIVGGSGNATIIAAGGNDVVYGLGTGNDSIVGGSGNATITGGSGNDIIYGLTTGNDSIVGGSGNNTIIAAGGNDVVYGLGTGNDSIVGGSGNATITGGSGNDIIYGLTTGNDSIVGGSGNATIIAAGGNDVVYGLGTGNDSIVGGSGNATITGGSGNDIIYGLTTGNDSIVGGSGNNTIIAAGGNDVVYGLGTGNDSIVGGSGNATITGGSGNDIIYGLTTGNDSIVGGSGNNTIIAAGGNDVVYGLGTGNDSIVGGSGNATITGGSGNDIIYGLTTGNDSIVGGSGNNTIIAAGGNDVVYGLGTGNDSIVGGSGNATITGGSGNDVIYGLTTGNDSIVGGSGNNTITGGAGNDIIYGLGTGNDSIVGGSGNATIIAAGGNDVVYGLGTGNDSIVGGSGNATITGGSGNDVIYGLTTGNDSIVGGSGNNTITGGSGNDIIYGLGTGNDSIVGGSGNATIVAAGGNDVVYGLTTGNDSIVGGTGNATIVGGSGNDVVYGLTTGNDSIVGGSGNATIIGGGGNDVILGGPTGDDTIIGGSGNATITGGGGGDLINGGPGNDLIYGGLGSNTISGGGGSDVIHGCPKDWLVETDSGASSTNPTTPTTVTLTNTQLLMPGFGTESISGFTNIMVGIGEGSFLLDAHQDTLPLVLVAGTGDDTILAGSGNDTVYAGSGVDSLVGGGGNDTYVFGPDASGNVTVNDGPTTNNTLDFSLFNSGISLDLKAVGPQVVSQGVLTLTLTNTQSVDEVYGTSYPDTIFGNGRNDTLVGNGGDDYLDARGGAALVEGYQTQVVYLDFLPGAVDYSAQSTRDAIQARISAIYSDFNFIFTQTQPTSGPYETLDFNIPAGSYLGGEATQLDWRNLDLGGQASVDISGFLGGPDEPADTVANVINTTATIGAHELGHLSGLIHGDSFGPIGAGVYVNLADNPYLDGYTPNYDGPDAADETRYHVMGSPDSVGTTLFDAATVTFFGEREAISMAFADSGTAVNETTGTSGLNTNISVNTAEPLTLSPLVVPNTDLIGQNVGDVFSVTAADVIGAIQLGANGQSNADYYSFTATKGELLNFQVYSASITRDAADLIDSELTIYESDGTTVVPDNGSPNGAFNDDGFQDVDAVILDLTMPYTGTYYVKVSTYAVTDSLNIVHNSDIGNYELFMYSFAASTPSTSGEASIEGDTLVGGSGQDTLVGSSANDLIEVAAGDTVINGSGTNTIDVLPADVTIYGSTTSEANETVVLTSSFLTSNPGGTDDYDWHVVSTNGQVISDQTGLMTGSALPGALSASQMPEFSFIPDAAGLYTITLTITDGYGGTGQATFTDTVGTPPSLTPVIGTGASAIAGTVGTSVNLTASFTGTTTPASYAWTVAIPGSSSSINGSSQNFSFTPTVAGNDVVTLEETDATGRRYFTTQTIVVAPVTPVAQILGVPSNLFVAEGYSFSLSSLVTNDSATASPNESWTITPENDPSQATTVSGSSVSYKPNDIGTYTVTLSVLDNNGQTLATSSTQIISIGVAPTATLTGGPAGGTTTEGTPLTFGGSASSPSTITTANGFYYTWTVTYAGITYVKPTTTLNNPAFSFTPGQAGTYLVSLEVNDYHGFTSLPVTETVVVAAVAPRIQVAGLPTTSSIVEGSTVSLGSTVSNTSAIIQSNGYSEAWTVQYNGQTYGPYDGPSLNFTAGGVGSYLVTTTATDIEGVIGTTAETIVAADVAPTITSASSPSSTVPLQAIPTAFNLGSVSGPGLNSGVSTVVVNWGDSTSPTSFTINAQGSLGSLDHAYDLPGNYQVIVTVTDQYGLSGMSSFTTSVAPVAPAPTILDAPISMDALSTVTLASSVSDLSNTETAQGFQYLWSVMLGTKALSLPSNTTDSSTFAFDPQVGGTYTISLAVTDSSGSVGQAASQTITVNNVAPIASISGGVSGVPLGTAITLTGSAVDPTGVATASDFTYQWTVTGPSTSLTGSGASFTYTPAYVGSYTVDLVATDILDNLSSGVASVTETFVKGTPVITWNPPAAISYGALLSATQLDASTTVAGTFAYTPAAGTLLGVGSQVLSVIFTPTDQANQSVELGEVTLLVNQGTPVVTALDAGGTYNAGAFPATAKVVGVTNGATDTNAVTFCYSGKTTAGVTFGPTSTAPTEAGSYSVTATVAMGGDYVSAASLPLSFTIGQATPIVTALDAGGVYTGKAYSAGSSVAGVTNGATDTNAVTYSYSGTTDAGVKLTNVSSAPTEAGSYMVTATVAAGGDYASAASPALSFAIAQAAPTLSVTDAGGTYNANPFIATTSLSGVTGGAPENNAVTISYSGPSYPSTTTAPTAAGSYSATAAVAAGGDYASATASVSFVISSASTTTTLSSSSPVSVPGQSVTFTAVVAPVAPGGGAPLGSVKFYVGTSLLAVVQLTPGTGSSQASTTSSSLASGNLSITADYVTSSGNFVSSVSSSLAQTSLNSGVSVSGTTLYIIGSNAADYAVITPVGTSTTGSTGVAISATLNNAFSAPILKQTLTSIVIDGFGGNDTFQVASTITLPVIATEGNGNDYVQTGGGNDVITLGTGSNDVFGGGGNKTIIDQDAAGTSGYIQLGTGNDSISLGSGNDQVDLAGGSSTVTGGNGNDTVINGNGAACVVLGNGNDYINTDIGIDAISLGNGNETIVIGGGSASVTTGNGNNFISAGSLGTGTDSITMGNGNDTVSLGNGTYTVSLGSGNDSVAAVSGNTAVTAGGGNDTVELGNGVNSVTLGSGNDFVSSGTGGTTVIAGNGNDSVQLGGGTNSITLGNGNDYVSTGAGNSTVTAGNGNDTIQLGAGTNSITLGGGNDYVSTGNGNATVTAGGGNDTVQLGTGAGMTVAITLGNGNDYVSTGDSNDTVTVGTGNDTTQLGNGTNVVVEGSGTDYVSAGNGANLVVGGTGQHTIQLGNGKNVLIDGSATVVPNPRVSTLAQFLSNWNSASPTVLDSDLKVTYNSSHPNYLYSGTGRNWFFYTYSKTVSNKKPSDNLN